MLIYFVAAVTALGVAALVWLLRALKRRRVYGDFDELIEALSAEGHDGLFIIAEDEMLPIAYPE